MHENESKFYRKIIMSDEAHFHFGGYVNKQNFRIWAPKTQKWLLKSRFIRNVQLFNVIFGQKRSLGPTFLKMKLERLFRWMDCAIESWLMNFYGQNWKIWMWTMFICNKTALRATQVAKPSVFCVKSFQTEWFLETAITIDRRDHAI